MSLAYKVEELLALRDSVSESAVSIDKFADEDVIKEHVLRPSASACMIGAGPTSTVQPPKPAGLTSAAAAIKKPSPSPSVKRGKAEKLLKEHGSPPGMRVTAGGRVVPSDLPPLTTSRFSNSGFSNSGFSNSGFKVPISRGVSPATAMGPSSQLDNINNAKVASNTQGLYTVNGQAFLLVDNQLVPLTNTLNNLGVGSPFNTGPVASYQVPDPIMAPVQQTLASFLSQVPQAPAAPVISAAASQNTNGASDLQTVKQQHIAKRQELKHLEQVEVLQAPHQSDQWRAATIEKKRNLIIEIDDLRKVINKLEVGGSHQANAPAASIQLPTPGSAMGLPQFQSAVFPPVYPNMGVPVTSSSNPNTFSQQFMFSPGPFAGPQIVPLDSAPFGAEPRFNAAENGIPGAFPMAPVANADAAQLPGRNNLGPSPTSGGRRSHAVEIKPPKDTVKASTKQNSTLDPKSPTYEPDKNKTALGPQGAAAFFPPSPSPRPTPERIFQKTSLESLKCGPRILKEKSSLSSVSTADFFPTNTHEHSMTRVAPNKADASKPSSREDLRIGAPPITPEKPWPGSPWNAAPRSGGRCTPGQYSSPLRMAAWSETFGEVKTSTLPRRVSNNGLKDPGEKDMCSVSAPPALAGTGNVWQSPVKAATRLPSTYQEGYQAGRAHSGLPLNAEVIRGYIDGLMDTLRHINTHGTSISSSASRGTRSKAAPLDFANVAESPSSANISAFGQENSRRGVDSVEMLTPTDDSFSTGFTFSNEGTGLPTQRTVLGQTVTMEKASNERKAAFTTENGAQPAHPAPQGDTQSSVALPRQFAGNQIGNQISTRRMSSLSVKQVQYEMPKSVESHGQRSVGPALRASQAQRYSGYDGAMDDLTEIIEETRITVTPINDTNTEASCFSTGKGKQKAASSPSKSSGSPKKPGEMSPAKARLESIASSIASKSKRDTHKDEKKNEDPTTMTFEEKTRWRENWRRRFQKIKAEEADMINRYHHEHGKGRPGF